MRYSAGDESKHKTGFVDIMADQVYFSQRWEIIMLEKYTNWLRECPSAVGLSIDPTSDHGPFPYQWKIESRDGLRLYGYVFLDGLEAAGSENEIRAYL
jgi:hypothetical protein